MHDLVIENALLCDGTGAAATMGSLAVRGGRIVALGRLTGEAAFQRIDAGGRALSPGFIDPHTHYDAQLAWDPLVTCSPLHGVTTVLFGNCGVGVAPVQASMREQVMLDLVGVEGISLDVMRKGIDWRWETWGQYLDALDGSRLGINVAGLMAYTPLRHYVMGADSRERAATDNEIAEMTAIFRAAMEEGAFGFSTSLSQTHVGADGRPVACRNASREELARMARVLRSFDRGLVGIALDSAGWNLINDQELSLLRVLAEESGKQVTCLSLLSKPGDPDFHDQTFQRLETLGPLAAKIVPQTSPRAIVAQCELRAPSFLAMYPSFRAAIDQPLDRQVAVYSSTAFRDAFMSELAKRNRTHFLPNMLVLQVSDASLKHHEGRTVGAIAAEQGRRPVDVFFDLAIQDGLATQFQAAAANYDIEGLERLIKDDRVLIGLSDGGAHNDMLCDAGYATAVLDIWVRQRKALTLEKAVRKMTAVPAQLMGMRDRGVLEIGKVADIALFDPSTVKSRTPRFVNDLPGGARRLVADAEGVAATIVAGRVVVSNGEYTGERPGRVLRAGRC
jgi:N-acyl-D-amino-acid deacylase